MSETVQAIIQNAERLLQDARLLAERGSYRTAIALAILSLEESGKACLVTWAKEGHLSSTEREALIRGHIDKQRIFATSRIFKAINSIGKLWRRTEITERYDEIGLDEFLLKFAEALATHATIPSETIERGLLDYWKQAGFYVDVDDALNVVVPAIEFSEEWFKMFANDANEALQMAKSEPYDHEILAVLYESYKKDWAMNLSMKERPKATIRVQLTECEVVHISG